MDVILVCHTEPGYVKGRRLIFSKAASDGVTGGVEQLASMADRYGAKVTFAVMPEVANRFPGGLAHEVGLHVHPGAEVRSMGKHRVLVGDKYLREHCRTSSMSTVLRDYPYEEQLAMITAGKDRLRDVLGVRVRTFVAGRWSVNDDTVRALVAEGFTHDCSAVPHKPTSHYDWSRLPRICMPYRPGRDDYQRRGNLPLLMVPVSQSLLGATATPELAPLVGLPWLKACFEEYYRQRLPLFHMCLHSPSMTDPYYRDVMDCLLRFIAGHDVRFRFASEIGDYGEVFPKADVVPYLAGINRNMLSAGPALAGRMMAAVRPSAGD
jgi:peptidoglycan/xylan/chitin deacetylase (PgdA/CDA1 family)